MLEFSSQQTLKLCHLCKKLLPADAEIMTFLSRTCLFVPFSIWRHFDRTAPATGKQEKQMGPWAHGCRWVLFFIDFHWLRSWWQGVSTRQGSSSISRGRAAGVRKGVKRASAKSWNVACWKGRAPPWSLTPVINVWNAVNSSADGKGLLQSQHFACIRERSHIPEHLKN